MPDGTRQHWTEATGTPVHEAYGMTECSTFISGSPARPAKPGALGCGQVGRRIAILDDGGQPVTGPPGVIAVHKDDPGLMLEYLDQPEDTAARFAGNWFVTGDQGRMDGDGQITYLGRNDDMMNAGGVRVSPIEIEDVLNAHPDVQTCAAVEVPVKDGVSVIAAFYTSERTLADETLNAHAAQYLARYKLPRLYRRIDQIPTGANGKLLRRALRENWSISS
jgi:acyl-coenzyme A synthetase/AMP-(fatty) acid ligase